MALVVGENSYVTVVEADSYFNSRYGSADWLALDESTKEILLISAARALDLYCTWLGTKTDPDQLLDFPRDGEVTVPVVVKDSQCEIAFSILENESPVGSDDPNLVKLKADVVELTFGDVFSTTNPIYNDFVRRMLSPFCSGLGSKKLTRV